MYILYCLVLLSFPTPKKKKNPKIFFTWSKTLTHSPSYLIGIQSGENKLFWENELRNQHFAMLLSYIVLSNWEEMLWSEKEKNVAEAKWLN